MSATINSMCARVLGKDRHISHLRGTSTHLPKSESWIRLILTHGACNSHCLCCGTAFVSDHRIVGAHAALVVQDKVLVVVAATCCRCNTGEREFTYGGRAVAIAEVGKAWFGRMRSTGQLVKKAYVTEMERLDNDFEPRVVDVPGEKLEGGGFLADDLGLVLGCAPDDETQETRDQVLEAWLALKDQKKYTLAAVKAYGEIPLSNATIRRIVRGEGGCKFTRPDLVEKWGAFDRLRGCNPTQKTKFEVWSSGLKQIVCGKDGCKMLFKTQQGKYRHQVNSKIHNPLFYCGKCNKSFFACEDKNQHQKECTAPKGTGPIVCGVDGCTDRFSTKDDMRQHLRRSQTHNDTFPCTRCKKPFGSYEKRINHQKNCKCNFTKHNCRGGPPHKCPNCTKSYAHISGLSRHKRSCAATANPKKRKRTP